MTVRCLGMALSGIVLACAGCVVPPPVPVATAAPAPQPPQNCREFQQTITVGGQPQQAYGTSCQQPDGSWKVVSQPSASPPSSPPAAAVPAYPAYPYYYPGYYYPGYYYGPPASVSLGFGFGGRFR